MEGEFRPEKKEEKDDVKLRVHDAQMEDKRLMIAFNAQTKEQFDAYNDAIAEVAEEEDLQPFHQIGQDFEKGMVSAWEMHADPDGAALEKLLPRIEKQAREFLSYYDPGFTLE